MQTSYTQYNNELLLGNIADTYHPRQIDSFLAQGAVGIAKAVTRGTNKARQCAQATTATGQGALIFGVALLSQTVEQSSAGLVQYNDKETVPVMRRGRIVVMTTTAVTAGNTANFVLASGNWTDAAVGAGIEATPQLKAQFVTSTSAAALAILEVHNAIV